MYFYFIMHIQKTLMSLDSKIISFFFFFIEQLNDSHALARGFFCALHSRAFFVFDFKYFCNNWVGFMGNYVTTPNLFTQHTMYRYLIII